MSEATPTYRHIWRIAWPVMAASLSQNFASVVDTFFLGHVGRNALAAGAIGVLLFLALGFIGLGLGTGVQILTAHLLGERHPEHLGDLMRQSLIIGILIGAFLTIANFLLAPALVAWLVSDSAIEPIATYFLKWRSLELFPLILFGVLRGYFSGIARTGPIFHANLILSLLAVGLNTLLVIGYNLGVRGIVISSVAAQYAATGYLFYVLRKQPYSLKPLGTSKWFRQLLRYAGPAILQNLVGMVGWFIFFLVIERRGSLALASANVVRTLYSFSMLPTWAYATAVGTLVGYFWAAREKSSLLKSFWQALRLSILTNVGIVGLLLLTAPWVVPVFAKNDPLIVRQVQKDLYMIAVSLLLMPASAILISAVVAVGQTIQAFLVEVGIIGLYLAYIFWLSEVLHAPLTILWSAEWVYWIPSTLILGWLFQRSLRLMRESPKTIPATAS
jgi:MATE family multidrug resistance protein